VDSIRQQIEHFFSEISAINRLVVAFSGGLDSTVLLYCIHKMQLPFPLVALHVNHQLSENASNWQHHCERFARGLDIEFESTSVEVHKQGKGLEQAAREARLKVLQQFSQPGDLILTGHHQRDQAETFLHRLARGAGVKGLGGMPPIRALGQARIARPLLATSKEQILKYAECCNLQWIEDESNQDSQFDRNFLRIHVLPLLESRWSNFSEQVSKASGHLRETEALLDAYVDADIEVLDQRRERLGVSVDMSILLQWPRPRRNAVIRSWLNSLGYQSPSTVQIAELENLLSASTESSPILNWKSCEIRRYRKRLYCLPGGWESDMGSGGVILSGVDLHGVTVPGESHSTVCFAKDSRGKGGLDDTLDYQVITREHSQAPTRGQPSSRPHSQQLKKLLHEYQLEPWLRDYVPLLLHRGQLAAVGDLWVEKIFWRDDGLAVKWDLGL